MRVLILIVLLLVVCGAAHAQTCANGYYTFEDGGCFQAYTVSQSNVATFTPNQAVLPALSWAVWWAWPNLFKPLLLFVGALRVVLAMVTGNKRQDVE